MKDQNPEHSEFCHSIHYWFCILVQAEDETQ